MIYDEDMGKNWALVIGVNEYSFMPNLRYAQKDAEKVRDYMVNEANFEKIFYFADNEPNILELELDFPSQPRSNNLRYFLRNRFEKSFMKPGDNFWFFHSGHGIRYQQQDYLMMSDSDAHPENIESTAISLNYIIERLTQCGADNIILLLDACRNENNSKMPMGVGTSKTYRQKGIITIFSCSPSEKSYEIPELEQGVFSYALLEGLRSNYGGTTRRLYAYLQKRVSELNNSYKQPRQTPYAIVEPPEKLDLILLDNQANEQDIQNLKLGASLAENKQDWDLAKQLWIRVNIASQGNDFDAIAGIERCSQKIPNSENDSTNFSKDSENLNQEVKPLPNQWELGKQLKGDRYTIEKLLGEGRFGLTYLAKDQKNNRFAIKTFNPKNTSKNNSPEKFWLEAMRLAKCNHPHIVTVKEPFEQEGIVCIPMEYIDGTDLEHRANAILSEEDALTYIHQVGDALIQVHHENLVHRDVKPANIMVRTGKAEAVLIDFGLARDFEHILSVTKPSEQAEAGYAPLEVYSKTAPRGAYTDVYSLSATLYNLVTGQKPVSAPYRSDELDNNNQDPLQPPKKINPNISDRLNNAIMKGMELRVENRPQSIDKWFTLLNLQPLKYKPNNLQKWSKIAIISLLLVATITGLILLLNKETRCNYFRLCPDSSENSALKLK